MGQSLQIRCAPEIALCLQCSETGLKVTASASVAMGHKQTCAVQLHSLWYMKELPPKCDSMVLAVGYRDIAI
jgi:hypothetical protein